MPRPPRRSSPPGPVELALQRRPLVGSLSPVEGELTTLGVGEVAVLVADTQKYLVGLGRMDHVVAHAHLDHGELVSFAPVHGVDDVDTGWDRRFSVIQGHLLEVVEQLRRHSVDDAVRNAHHQRAPFGVGERDGCLRRLLRGYPPALPLEPLRLGQLEQSIANLLRRQLSARSTSTVDIAIL